MHSLQCSIIALRAVNDSTLNSPLAFFFILCLTAIAVSLLFHVPYYIQTDMRVFQKEVKPFLLMFSQDRKTPFDCGDTSLADAGCSL
jgi:uncharacterized membrane protein YesL